MNNTFTQTHTPTLQSKLPQVGTSIFSVMSALAQEHKAINLAQGFPDFDCPEELAELVGHYTRTGHNQYAPMPGLLQLRQKISKKTDLLYGVSPDPVTEITITTGATEALFAAITAVVSAGDEVIVLEPAYDSYVPAILLSGGKPVFVPLTPPGFTIDWDLVKSKITPRTKLLILNSPHNPTGMVLKPHDLQALTELVQNTGIFIISDEVYEHMVFNGKQHLSVLQEQALLERSFVISSFGKTYHTTGWKIGYCIAPPALTSELRKIHQFLTFSSATPMQYAIADFIENKEHYLSLPDFYQQKRDLFLKLMQHSKFKMIPAAGTYFQLADYSAITASGDAAFAKKLIEETGVAAIPVSAFYHNQADHQLLRFCFAKKEETLRSAAQKLCRL
ncbi:MAG: methionine aminotransferase [Hymenobacteraceae bacterium]|nr:methionine aminotransferase [Hymenobacteraceae bacterium]